MEKGNEMDMKIEAHKKKHPNKRWVPIHLFFTKSDISEMLIKAVVSVIASVITCLIVLWKF